MPLVSVSKATLRIVGDALEPEHVSALLCGVPTQAWRKGDSFGKKNRSVRASGRWQIEAADRSSADLDGQINEVLDGLTNDQSAWRALANGNEIDLFCGCFMERANEGLMLSPQSLKTLADRGISLALEIYASKEAADGDTEAEG